MPAIRNPLRKAVPSAVVLLACCLSDEPVRAQVPPSGRETDAGYADLIDTIEAAFKACDPGLLRGAFPPRVKSYLASRALKIRPGYYGSDQAILILRRGFAGRTTLRFGMNDEDEDGTREGRRVVRARWLFHDDRTSRTEARLTFTVAREGVDWTIREIREPK